MSRDNMPKGAHECPVCLTWSMRERCPHCGNKLFAGTATTAPAAPAVVERERAKPRTPKLNDTEKRWWSEIPATHFPAHKVIPHGLLLPLTDGGVYTCDFYLLTLATIGTVIEIKGGYKGPGFEQGIERYRRARFEWEGYVKFELWDGENKKKWEVER